MLKLSTFHRRGGGRRVLQDQCNTRCTKGLSIVYQSLNYSHVFQLLFAYGRQLVLTQLIGYPVAHAQRIFPAPEHISARQGRYNILVNICAGANVHGISPAIARLKRYNRNAVLHCGCSMLPGRWPAVASGYNGCQQQASSCQEDNMLPAFSHFCYNPQPGQIPRYHSVARCRWNRWLQNRGS